MGIANIMPGVSGGTLALSFGIYDQIIGAISGIFRDFRKSFRFLFPLMLGMSIGIVCFTYLMEYLFCCCPVPSCLAFAGLILGGFPALWKAQKESLQKEKHPSAFFHPVHAALFLIFAAAAIFISLIQVPVQIQTVLQADGKTLAALFFLGILAAGTMIIPGVSGSLILMILGYYYGILNAVRSLFEAIRTLEIHLFFANLFLLIPFGTGIILGIFLFSRLIEYLFLHHTSAVYSAVMGLLLTSPAAILIHACSLSQLTMADCFLGSAAFLTGLLISWKMTDGV